MGVVFDITGNSCGEQYIGETARALGKRVGGYQKQMILAVWEHRSIRPTMRGGGGQNTSPRPTMRSMVGGGGGGRTPIQGQP